MWWEANSRRHTENMDNLGTLDETNGGWTALASGCTMED